MLLENTILIYVYSLQHRTHKFTNCLFTKTKGILHCLIHANERSFTNYTNVRRNSGIEYNAWMFKDLRSLELAGAHEVLYLACCLVLRQY